MAGQLPPDVRLRRLRRRGWAVLAGLAGVVIAAVAWNVARGLGPRARFVARPERPVPGIAVGSPVRLRGAEVGRVAAVGLWRPEDGGALRPEVALSVDLRRAPALADLDAAVAEGLRAEFLPVNPASGRLEVDLVWVPGSPAARHGADEIPCAPSDGLLADVAGLATRLGDWSARDLAAEAAALADVLDRVRGRLDQPGLAGRVASRAASLRARAEAVESALGAETLPVATGRMGETRESLRQVAERLDRLGASLGRIEPGLSADLAALAARFRGWAEDARGRAPASGR